MAVWNLGTARGRIQIDTNDLKNADIAIRSAGRGMLYFGAAATVAFAGIVKVAADFEKEMDFVQAVTTATADEMRQMEKAAIDMAKKSVYGPVELAAAMVELAKAGATTQQIIDGVLEASVNLAQAADVPVPFAGENLINIMNTFQLGAEEAARTSDLLAGAANASSVELEDIVTTMRYAGPVASTLGISIEDLNAAITALGLVGIKGSTAGTSLRFFMSRLVPDTKEAKDAIKQLGLNIDETTGAVIEFTDTEGKLLGLGEIFQVLQDTTKDMTQLQKADVINSLFGVRAMPTMLRLLDQGKEGFDALTAEIEKTTAADVAAKRMDNLDGAIKNLKATLQAAAVEGASPLLDGLKEMVQFLTSLVKWFGDLPAPVKKFLILAIGVVGVLSLMSAVFLLTIGNIVRAIRVIGELGPAIKTVSTVIRGLSSTLLASPLFWAIAAVIALAVAFYLLYTRSEAFREAVDNLWQSMQLMWDDITEAVVNFWHKLQEVWDGFLQFFKDIPEYASAAWEGIKQGFADLPDQIWNGIKNLGGMLGRFFADLGRDIGGWFAGLGRSIGGFFADLGGSIGRGAMDVFSAIGRFFENLPGIIGRALATAGRAVLGFLKELPSMFGRALGFILGLTVRIFVIEIPKLMLKGLMLMAKLVIKYLVVEQVKLWGRAFMLILRTVIEWFPKLVQAAWQGIQLLFKVFVWLFIKLPIEFVKMLWSLVTALIGFIPELIAGAWAIVQGIFDAFIFLFITLPWEFVKMLGNILAFLWEHKGVIVDAAKAIGQGIFDAFTFLFWDLPELIWDTLWEVGKKLVQGVQLGWKWAKDFASSLWEGFKDGLGISSPSYIERAMDAVTANALDNFSTLKGTVKRMNALTNRLPQYEPGSLGLTPASTTAVNTNGGGQVWQQNAPLVGQASIRDDRDITLLARQLQYEAKRTARARGMTVSDTAWVVAARG